MDGGGGVDGGGEGPPKGSTVHVGRVELYRPRRAHSLTTTSSATMPKMTGHAP